MWLLNHKSIAHFSRFFTKRFTCNFDSVPEKNDMDDVYVGFSISNRLLTQQRDKNITIK